MKIWIVILIFISGCTLDSEIPEFFVGERVSAKFDSPYAGCNGIIKKTSVMHWVLWSENQVEVELDGCETHGISVLDEESKWHSRSFTFKNFGDTNQSVEVMHGAYQGCEGVVEKTRQPASENRHGKKTVSSLVCDGKKLFSTIQVPEDSLLPKF